MMGVCFMPVLFMHFTYLFLGKKAKKGIILAAYLLSTFFAASVYSPLYAIDPRPFLVFPYWLNAKILFTISVTYFALVVGYSLLILWRGIRASKGSQKNQKFYILIGCGIGFIAGFINYLVWYRISILPVFNIFVSISVLMIAYAIVKYRLMDIRLAITSAGIFFMVYAVSLGLPFFLMAKGCHWAALVTMAGLASFAPSLYSRLQKQAEDRILEEQKAYQDILLKASQGLTRLKKVEEITRFVVNVILKAIRIKSAGFYLFDGQKYVLKDRDGDVSAYATELADRSPVVDYLNYHGAVFLDELKYANPNGAETFDKVREFFKEHPANVATPVMRDGNTFGYIFLGEKANNTSYSERDLTVLTVIADQMALAMENAVHLEMTKKDFIEQMHDRRLKDVGLLGSTISHQMCNRLQKITLALEYAQSVLNEQATLNDTKETITAKLKECLVDFEMAKREALSAADISDALKTFSKSGTEPSAVPLKRVVKMAKDLVDAKHKGFHYSFAEEFDPDLMLWVNISAMQDVLFNAFDNSLDAIKIKQKSGNCPPGFAPLISVSAYANGTMAVVEVVDNGAGFRPEDLEKVFIPFFTTKGTMEGTGLGLHAMRELVRRNNGDIVITSEFFQWARVTINLPLATLERLGATQK